MPRKREGNSIAKKQLALRDTLWPDSGAHLWNRKTHDGFTTIPKTMPLILKAMDELTKNTPVSSTYLSLWCATWDNSFVSLSKVSDLANASGFGGQRGERTWASRVKLLAGLDFISIKPSAAGDLGHALIFNPHWILRLHHDRKTPGLTEATYNALLERAIDIGAADMTEPNPLSPAMTGAA